MRHTLRFLNCDNEVVLLEEHTLAYGLVCGYEHGAVDLGVPPGSQVRMELLDDNGYLLDSRTYLAAAAGAYFPLLPAAG